MRGAFPSLSRLLSLSLVLSIGLGFPSWGQVDQPAPAKPPAQTQPPPSQPPPQTQPQPQGAPEEAPAPVETPGATVRKGATLKGHLLAADRTTPLPGAVVHAVSPDGTLFSSAPADPQGAYSLSDLLPGTYTLVVSVEGAMYYLESPVGVTSAQTFTVDLATVPAAAATATVPGLTDVPRGFCYIIQGGRPGGTSFWKSPKGIILLAVTAGAIGLILSNSGGKDEKRSVSPSAP